MKRSVKATDRIRRKELLYSKLRAINDDKNDDILTVAIYYRRLGLKPKGMHFSDGKVPRPKRTKGGE